MECPHGGKCRQDCIFFREECLEKLSLLGEVDGLSEENKLISRFRKGEVEVNQGGFFCPYRQEECRQDCQFWSYEAKDCLLVLAYLKKLGALSPAQRKAFSQKKVVGYVLPRGDLK
jgi:hypothetical protein